MHFPAAIVLTSPWNNFPDLVGALLELLELPSGLDL